MYLFFYPVDIDFILDHSLLPDKIKNSKTGSIFFNAPLHQANCGKKSWCILILSVEFHFSDYDIFKSVFNSSVRQKLKSVLKFYNWPSREGKILQILALTSPNMPLPLWTPSPTEASNDELCQKSLVVLTYNTIKGFKNEAGYEVCGLLWNWVQILHSSKACSARKWEIYWWSKISKQLFCLLLLIQGINLQLQC